jgi:hypothetical protein
MWIQESKNDLWLSRFMGRDDQFKEWIISTNQREQKLICESKVFVNAHDQQLIVIQAAYYYFLLRSTIIVRLN